MVLVTYPLDQYKPERAALHLKGTAFLIVTFQAIGIVYSDIGTSPLYVLNGIWSSSGPVPSEEDVIGGISAIIWALTLIPLIKYVLITLQFGTTEGEGGTFALYQGLFPPEVMDDDDDRALTGDSAFMRATSRRSSAEKLAPIKWFLLPWTLFGTAAAIADGIFTPAVSVTSAVAGIALKVPSVSDSISPISIALLVVLFLAQRFGVAKLSVVFAPVTCLWLLLIGGAGIYNITTHPAILKAFDPSRLVMFFVRTKQYDYLAGILLALTGCEAMFANLGQFNKTSIQISFSFFVYPMIILAYLGQGARLIVDGENVISNIFYATIPGSSGSPLYWITYVMAIFATMIASQAMITACFSLVQQLVNMKCLPNLSMVYTSETIQGQVYFPFVNYLLLIGTSVVVSVFKNLANMTNAYGFAVSTVMFITTTLVALQIYFTKHLPIVLALGFFLTFGFFEGLFWGASLRKVPHGAWVPLMIGGVLAAFMLFWTWGKGLEDRFDGMNRRSLRNFITFQPASTSEEKSAMQSEPTRSRSRSITFIHPVISNSISEDIVEKDTGEPDSELPYRPGMQDLYLVPDDEEDNSRIPLRRINVCSVFHKLTSGTGVPHTFYGFLKQWPALPRVVIFLSVRTVSINHVPREERYAVTKVRTIQGFYGVTYAMGFRDHFDMSVGEIIERICALESRIGVNDEIVADKNIAEIRIAAARNTHIVPHYHVVSKRVKQEWRWISPAINWVRSLLIESLYRRVATMFPQTENWVGSADEIVRVEINAEI